MGWLSVVCGKCEVFSDQKYGKPFAIEASSANNRKLINSWSLWIQLCRSWNWVIEWRCLDRYKNNWHLL